MSAVTGFGLTGNYCKILMIYCYEHTTNNMKNFGILSNRLSSIGYFENIDNYQNINYVYSMRLDLLGAIDTLHSLNYDYVATIPPHINIAL